MANATATQAPVPDQLQANSLAEFIEAAGELRRDPFFGPVDKSAPNPGSKTLPTAAEERAHARPAWTRFRRIWAEGQASQFFDTCELLKRYEDCGPQLDRIGAQHKQHTERQWPHFSLSAGEVVNLWMNSVFEPPGAKGQTTPEGRQQSSFDTLVAARGRKFIETICKTTVSAVGTCYFDLLKVAQPALARWQKEYGLRPEFDLAARTDAAPVSAAANGDPAEPRAVVEAAVVESKQERFERILGADLFKGLKAILDSVSANRAALCDGVTGANSYSDLLAKLGYRVTLTRQIHVQDCYSRLGPAGGIKAVLPYHDIPTQSSLPTLVNFDSTVTTTAKSAGFFDELLAKLKHRLVSPN